MSQVFNYVTTSWNQNSTYKANDVVTVDMVNYVAKQDVPSGTALTNENYWYKWVVTGAAGIDALQNQITDVRGQLDTANSNISTLQGDITDVQGQLGTANSNISTLQGDITGVQGQLGTANSKISTLQGDITDVQGQLDTANSKISTLQGDLSEETEARTSNDASLQTSINYLAGFTPAE